MIENNQAYSEVEQEIIRTAATHILEHPSFRTSERSSRLFQFLLDRAIVGEATGLKERHIGHEVFGREIGYDTALDPVVRNAASETRKRLRQYDAETGAAQPVRVLLNPGTYVLDFRFSSAAEQHVQPIETSVLGHSLEPPGTTIVPTSVPETVGNKAVFRQLRVAYVFVAALAICCIALAAVLLHQRGSSSEPDSIADSADPLWAPMFSSGKEVFVSLGHAVVSPSNSSGSPPSGAMERITITDLKAYTNISGFLQQRHQQYQMRTDTDTTLLDLRARPVVLIGNRNNAWAARLTQNVRYRFDFDSAHTPNTDVVFSIIDSQHPEKRVWQTNISKPMSTTVDYAVVGRFFDPTTGGLVLYLAGAGPGGTEAASEFITQARFLRTLPDKIRNPRTNFEVVLKTPIISGIPGSPEVIATEIQ
jgi:hypothetical protein